MSDKGSSTIVVDNGSGSCKAGLAGDDEPKTHFPTSAERNRYLGNVIGPGVKENVGCQGQLNHGTLNVKYPIENGTITNWDEMEKIWHHIFKELGVDTKKHCVLLSEAPDNPKSNREKMTQIMFERFNVPSACLSNQAVLSLFATGRMSGLVLDCGDGPYSYAVPINQGYAVRNAVTHLRVAGCHITEFMMDILNTERSYLLSTDIDRKIVRDVKDKLCYVALDFEKEVTMAPVDNLLEKSYKIPDGRVITISSERFRCSEALFQPILMGMQANGLHQFANYSILNCDTNLQKDLYANILLTGGTTMIPGMTERMQKEMIALAPSAKKIKIIAPIERKYSAWRGGSMLASMPTFKQMCITKREYDEYGPSIVHKKCP